MRSLCLAVSQNSTSRRPCHIYENAGILTAGLAVALVQRVMLLKVGRVVSARVLWPTRLHSVFVCVATLAILDKLDEVDKPTLSWWLAERQLPNGGLNGRPEKLEDVRPPLRIFCVPG
jgi:hypothetical protein